MKYFIIFASIFISCSVRAGDMYLRCGYGEEEHWDNFTDSLLDENKKGMIVLKDETKS